MPATTERRIAIFLDFENLVTNTGIDASNLDLETPIDRLLEKGKVIFRRAYCDWSRFSEAKVKLHDLGVELVDVPPSTRAGKNAADMRLVIDALELCYARSYIDTFVLGSGDSDFCPLAYKLRENDRTVIGLGVKGSTSNLFLRACDEFLYLKPKAGERKRAAGKGVKSAVYAEAGSGEAERAPEVEAHEPPIPPAAHKHPRPARHVPQIARDVVTSLLSQASGPINPSLIKETLVRRQPDFDEREHGFSSFSKLLEALEGEKLLRRQQGKGKQLYVVGPEVPIAPIGPEGGTEEGPDELGGGEPETEIPF
jgi:uncharacterized LabA/DUF88 family protein